MNTLALLALQVGIIIVGLFPPYSIAFSPIAATHPITVATTTTSLRSIMYEPPAEENCELDSSDCEESIFDRKKREKAEANDAIKERYHARGIELNDVDLQESVDQYQNAETGGNLIPGVFLTSMCEDD